MTKDQELLQKLSADIGVTLSKDEIEVLLGFQAFLYQESSKANLTSIPENDSLELHLVDSLSIVPLVPNTPKLKILDLGTGAGLPGIPLAILRPDLEICLIDAREKKVQFLERCIEKFGLDNVQAYHGRAEDLGREKMFREKFDFVFTRAFASLPLLFELSSPFVKVGGLSIAMKGQKASEELKEATSLLPNYSLELRQQIDFLLPLSKAQRSILLFNKFQAIAAEYPRSAQVLAKKKSPKTNS